MSRNRKHASFEPECDPPPFAKSAKVEGTKLTIKLNDGTTAVCSLKPYPGLRISPIRARKKVRVIGPGIAVGWPDLGYEMLVEHLLKKCMISKKPKTHRR